MLRRAILSGRMSCFNARFSVMEDGRNFIVSLKMAEERVLLQQNQLNVFKDKEFGHSMMHINSPNINDSENYAFNLFKSVMYIVCSLICVASIMVLFDVFKYVPISFTDIMFLTVVCQACLPIHGALTRLFDWGSTIGNPVE